MEVVPAAFFLVDEACGQTWGGFLPTEGSSGRGQRLVLDLQSPLGGQHLRRVWTLPTQPPGGLHTEPEPSVQ